MTPRRRFRLTLLLTGALLVCPPPLEAQETTRVRTEENFRRVPNGEVLARLQAGTPVRVVGRQGGWREVVVEGWIWTRSLQMTDQEGMDLVVSEAEGENLRSEPSGSILGRLDEGTLLEELERVPGWIRARRQGWIWGESLVETAAPTAVPEAGPASSAPEVAAEPPSRRPTGVATAGPGGAAILTAPDGDTLALARAGRELEVTGRQGSWARVRVEGWTWLPARDTVAGASDPESPGGEALTPADLASDPQAHAGRVVTWTVQFISLEEAERVRTDFFEGEPFLLTRYGGVDGPFVYVAVPPERLGEVSGLTPLERLSVTGRVRTAASSLTGTPILDLMTMSRGGGGR